MVATETSSLTSTSPTATSELVVTKAKSGLPQAALQPTVAKAYSAEGSCGYDPQRPAWGTFTGDWERPGDPNAEALHTSLVYIKVPKTGSSTIGGIIRRIAEYNGLFGAFEYFMCLPDNHVSTWKPFFASKWPVVCADHTQRAVMSQKYAYLFDPAIYVGSLRHPIKRWISRYSFSKPSEGLKHFYKGFAYHNNFQYQYLTPNYAKATAGFSDYYHRNGKMWAKYDMVKAQQKIDMRHRNIDHRTGTDDEVREMLLGEVISSYLFLIIPERMDECLVVLKHKLGLPSLKHMIYYSSKVKPGKLRFEDYPTSVQVFIESEEFVSGNRWDLLLHELANKSLECEIQRLGLAFAEDLERFREMMRRVNEMCTLKNDSDCYIQDCGCNRGCHDMVSSLPEFHGW